MKLYEYQKELLQRAIVSHMIHLEKSKEIYERAQMNCAYEIEQLDDLKKLYKMCNGIEIINQTK